MLPDDYKAALEGAALVKKDWYGIVRLTGADRVSWLQGMVTNDIQKLSVGRGCYAGHLSPQGKMIAHMLILRDNNDVWLELERSRIPHLVSAFDKLLIMEDVQVVDESESLEVLAVIGARAETVFASWLGMPLNLPNLYEHRMFGGSRIVRTNLGYDLWARRADVDRTLNSLRDAGGTTVDRETWDVLRTEFGWPIFGTDIDETTTMPELGEHGISYDKGCYVGQEVVAKVKYIGHVNRRFVGLIIEGDALPKFKSAIQKNGKEVGYVTSSVFSPRLNTPIALGFVARAAYAPGTGVEIVSDGTAFPATISDLPFVIPGKTNNIDRSRSE